MSLFSIQTIVLVYMLSICGAFVSIAPSNDCPPLYAQFKNDLISISIPIETDTLNFYTDTGGKNFLYKSGIRKLNLKSSGKNLWKKSNLEWIFRKNDIPIPYERKIYFLKDETTNDDGMLGREWFANKVWRVDYEHSVLETKETSESYNPNQANKVKLYFKTDATGNHTHHLIRIQMIVESDTLSVLFDTGASVVLSDEAQKELRKDKLVATSFINASTFEKWVEQHPEWNVLRNADFSFNKAFDLIIVPKVQIGNSEIGPVEFVKRDDSNFEIMSELFMDKEIVGAIGGNALSQLRQFTIDYKMELLIIKSIPDNGVTK